jgi:SOS-response transcriptional repressor LexA
MSTLSEKIRSSLNLLTEMHGLTEADLCRNTSISQATLWRLLHSDIDPRASTLNAIASYFNVSVDQLLGNQPITKNTIQNDLPTNQRTLHLPIFSLDHPDELLKMRGQTNPSNWKKWIEVESNIKDSCFAVEVIGESMWPNFLEGVLIIIDPELNPKNKDHVLCKLHDSDDIIFRQYIEENGEYFLKAINHVYKTLPLKKHDSILGVIIQSKNKFIG